MNRVDWRIFGWFLGGAMICTGIALKFADISEGLYIYGIFILVSVGIKYIVDNFR